MLGDIYNVRRYWFVWSRGDDNGGHVGYISSEGGFTKKERKAQRFTGAGFAIAAARLHGIAIVNTEP